MSITYRLSQWLYRLYLPSLLAGPSFSCLQRSAQPHPSPSLSNRERTSGHSGTEQRRQHKINQAPETRRHHREDRSSAGNSPAQRCCQRCSPVGRSSGRPSPQCLQEQEHTQPSVSTGSTNALQCLRKAKRSRAAADGALAVSRSLPSLSGLVLKRSRPPQIACVLTRFLEHRSRPDDCQLVNRLSRRADMRSSSRNPHGKHTRKTHVKSDT